MCRPVTEELYIYIECRASGLPTPSPPKQPPPSPTPISRRHRDTRVDQTQSRDHVDMDHVTVPGSIREPPATSPCRKIWGSGSVRSSHYTFSDYRYTLRQRFPNSQQSRCLTTRRRLDKLVLPSIFDTSLLSLTV